MKIKDSIALITGGANGLGLAIAQHLADAGAKVIVFDIDETMINLLPDGIEGVIVDVTDQRQTNIAVKEIVDKIGAIDIVINNAGVIHSEPFVNLLNPSSIMHDYDRFHQNLLVNLESVFIVTSAVVEQMVRRRKRGCIINISSISAEGNAGQIAYSAAKAGVNAMTVALSKELGRLGIRCNAVSPGFISTDSTQKALSESLLKYIKANTPLYRLGKAEEVANAVASLIENDFINGVVLQVNGGLTI